MLQTLTAKNILETLEKLFSVSWVLHFHLIWYLSVTCKVMSINWPPIVLFMFSNRAVIMHFVCSNTSDKSASSSSGDDFHHNITFYHYFSIHMMSVYTFHQRVTDSFIGSVYNIFEIKKLLFSELHHLDNYYSKMHIFKDKKFQNNILQQYYWLESLVTL